MKTGLIPGEIIGQRHPLPGQRPRRSRPQPRRDRDPQAGLLRLRFPAALRRRASRRAIFLEVAPKLGIRETRRVTGQYVLTEADVRGNRRFDDAIGLCNSPVDVHEPGGSRAIMDHVGVGYGIPYRCHDPAKASTIWSWPAAASRSTRSPSARPATCPACTMTGEAAAIAAALAGKARCAGVGDSGRRRAGATARARRVAGHAGRSGAGRAQAGGLRRLARICGQVCPAGIAHDQRRVRAPSARRAGTPSGNAVEQQSRRLARRSRRPAARRRSAAAGMRPPRENRRSRRPPCLRGQRRPRSISACIMPSVMKLLVQNTASGRWPGSRRLAPAAYRRRRCWTGC